MARVDLIPVPDGLTREEAELLLRVAAQLQPEEKALLLEAMRLRVGPTGYEVDLRTNTTQLHTYEAPEPERR